MITLNDVTVNEKISTNPLVVVQLGAAWCMPCKQLKPKVEKMSTENQDVLFVYVDIEESHCYAMKSNVMSVPTVIGYRNGVEVDRVVGNSEPAVKKLLEKLHS